MIGSSVEAAGSSLRINEIAWMGTESSWADEWIELYNSADKTINLKDWRLVTQDENLQIDLQGEIAPDSFFILERTDDKTLSDTEADQIYTGGLNNNGQYLKLKRKEVVLQEVNDKAGWRAGRVEGYKTMEKGKKWHTSRKEGGTPGKVNSEPEPEKEQMPARPLTTSLPQTTNFWFTLVMASITAIFSVFIIFYLKQLLEVEN
ncbi:MAG: lamin tail domain-containing protein [Candidatus Paceibacterota bacterium]